MQFLSDNVTKEQIKKKQIDSFKKGFRTICHFLAFKELSFTLAKVT